MSSILFKNRSTLFIALVSFIVIVASVGCATDFERPVTMTPSLSQSLENGSDIASAQVNSSVEKTRNVIVELGNDVPFQNLLDAAPGSVLVDFYADWCPPCRRQSKILHAMRDDLTAFKATVIKVNVDKHQELARRLNVTSLPTLLVVKDGQLTQRQSGMADQERLSQWLGPIQR